MLRFLLLPLLPGGGDGIANVGRGLHRRLFDSIRVGLASTLWALAVGIPLAWLFERRRWPLSGAMMLVLGFFRHA